MVKVKNNPVKKHAFGVLAEIHHEQRQTTCAIPKIAVARYGPGMVTIRHKCRKCHRNFLLLLERKFLRKYLRQFLRVVRIDSESTQA